MQDDSSLRKWCIEKAIESGAGENCLEVAESLFQFVKDGKDIEEGLKSLKDAKSLTSKQKEVIEAMKELRSKGEEVNGSSIGRHLGITQSYASSILRKLIELGHVKKEGYRFWPVDE